VPEAGVIVRPVPPVKAEDNVTVPANPAEFTATDPDGRLPIVRVSVAELPEANDKLGPVGVPLEVVMLKFCGRTTKLMVMNLVKVPIVPDPRVDTVYEPRRVVGLSAPTLKVAVEVPEAPGIEVWL